jgi:glycosyltransferase involved in cell wall biosynthesis
MSILEAFAAGIPVVATPLPAVIEVVEEGRNGSLVPVGDVDKLAIALARLIDDAPLRRRMGDAGRADHAARFAIEPYVEKLADLWRAVRCEAKAPAALPNAAEPQQ